MNRPIKTYNFEKYISFVNGTPYIFYSVEHNIGTSNYYYETKSEPLEEYFKKNNLETLSVY